MQARLRTYSSWVQTGRLTETIVDRSYPEEDWGYAKLNGAESVKGYFVLVDKYCVTVDQRQRLAADGYDDVGNTQTRWLPYKAAYYSTLPNATTHKDTLSFSLLVSHCLPG